MAGTGFIGGSVRVDLRLLGPFTVTVAAEQGDRPVTVGPRQQRLVLAVLAWEAALFERVSSPGDETTALVRLSGVLVSTGRLDEATRVAGHAVERAALYPSRRLDARARNALGLAHGAAGRARDAIEQYELALVLAEEFGLREEQCVALLGLAANRIALGARATGVAAAEQALELARARGYQLLEGQALALLVEAVG